MSGHANQMDAVAYWRQFITAFYFEAVGDEISGTIVSLEEEGPTKDPEPRIVLQTKDGDRVRIIASQERLKGLLKGEGPAVGDWVGIRYTGDAEKAVGGRTPAKLFTVVVRRKGSSADGPRKTQPPAGTGEPAVRGSAEGATENGQGAGS